MANPSGQWLSLREYAERFHLPIGQVQKRLEAGELVKKRVDGLNYLWVVEGDPVEKEPEAKEMADSAPEPPAPSVEPAPPGPTLPGPTQDLMLRTDRALSLVEKSMNTFMLMHRELITEKERLLQAIQGRVEEKAERLRELGKLIQQREQEVADLKMLVGVLEDQLSRARIQGASIGASDQGRTVGDLIQDQLAYLMEDQMLRELVKE